MGKTVAVIRRVVVMRLDRARYRALSILILVTSLASVPIEPAQAQSQPVDTVLEDPVTMGAWLYGGNCSRCHGPYGDDRFAKRLTAKTSMPAFGFTNGGPLKRRDIDAVVAFISAWETAGAPPPLPDHLIAEINRIAPPVAASVTSPASAEAAALAAAAAAPAAVPAAPQRERGNMETNRATISLWLHNALVLGLYCILGVPVLFVLVIGLLFASQLGYRGNREPPGGQGS
jgi:hypothetical protein